MTYLGAVIPSVILWQIVVVMNCFGTTICILLTDFGPKVCEGLSVLRIDAIRAVTALSLGIVEIYRYSTISNFSQGIVWLIGTMTLLLVVHILEIRASTRTFAFEESLDRKYPKQIAAKVK